MQPLFLVSDAHLGAETKLKERHKCQEFFGFLNHVQEQQGRLIICGDLFDFWFEYHRVIMQDHFETLTALYGLRRTGVPIDYLAGNHDFWLGTFLESRIGLVIHPDDFVIHTSAGQIYLRHGDGLLRNDHGYRLLKRILRHPLNIKLYRLLHPDVGIPLALFFSHLSRNSKKELQAAYDDTDYRQFAYKKIENGYDMVVLGHTHWAAIEKYHRGWYLNPGSWMLTRTFLKIDTSGPSLLQWKGGKGIDYDPPMPPGNNKHVTTVDQE
ncbi:UDP-2,3-diacylglucosamine diphosphatase [candidate division KSB1 bacterium]|nr:UDP-2,3-diacylglucosamine diphosphatase [candidate division KSB1 bacterium]